MADLLAANVTYTAGQAHNVGPRGYQRRFTLSFGDGALTYLGGIPLTKAKLGCPNNLDDLIIADPANANGFIYKFDKANELIEIYALPALDGNALAAGAQLAEIADGVAIAATSLVVEAIGY